MRSYTHWLKIRGTISTREEAKQFREIQSYLDRYPKSSATLYLYEYNLFDYVVKLECNQNWDDLDLYANSGFHALTRLSHKPANICNPQPFTVPERLTKTLSQNDRDHAAR